MTEVVHETTVGKLKGAFMRNAILAFSALLAISIASPHVAQAAPVNDVLGACDRTAGCDYKTNKAGDISGCSKQACFYCPNDGKRECFGVGARAGKAASKGVAGSVGGVKIEPMRGKRQVGSAGTSVTGVKTGGKKTNVKTTSSKTTNQNLQNKNATQERRHGGGKH
jgi:hypothetical protein